MPGVELDFIFPAIMFVRHEQLFIDKKIPYLTCQADMCFCYLTGYFFVSVYVVILLRCQ